MIFKNLLDYYAIRNQHSIENKKVIFKNLTDRVIYITDIDGKNVTHTLNPESRAAFSTSALNVVQEFNGVPVVQPLYEDALGIPLPEKDVIFIVKFSVLRALNGCRLDVVSPDTSPSGVVRDEITGKVRGIRNFQVL